MNIARPVGKPAAGGTGSGALRSFTLLESGLNLIEPGHCPVAISKSQRYFVPQRHQRGEHRPNGHIIFYNQPHLIFVDIVKHSYKPLYQADTFSPTIFSLNHIERKFVNSS